jgi:hypothetical protein
MAPEGCGEEHRAAGQQVPNHSETKAVSSGVLPRGG